MNILVLRSYGDYVILLNSLRNTTIKQPIHLIVSNHLQLLHEALDLDLPINIHIRFANFKIQNAILSFFTNKHFFSLGTIKELISLRQYFKSKKNENYFIEHRQKSLLLQFFLGIKLKFIYHQNNVYNSFHKFFEVQPILNEQPSFTLNSSSTVIIFPDSRKKNKIINSTTISKLVMVLDQKAVQYKIAKFSSGIENKNGMLNEINYSNFTELVEIIKKANFIISSDSLPVHIAELYYKPHWILYNHKINTNWLTPSSCSSNYYSTFDQTNLIKIIFN
jgi:ADP-heptose:LPS heptosyltransferase